jgi:activating signal cointegrator 1
VKALSLWQPWASAIPAGLKRIETRSWRTTYRGRLAIHAAMVRNADVRDCWTCMSADDRPAFAAIGVARFDDLPFGAIVATCDLVDCRRTEDCGAWLGSTEEEWGNFAPGRFGWILDNIVRLEIPVPVRGAQGLFEWRAAA